MLPIVTRVFLVAIIAVAAAPVPIYPGARLDAAEMKAVQ